MIAILTTNTGRARISAEADFGDGVKIVVPYDYSSRRPHAVAAEALARKLGWTGTWVEGTLPDGRHVFTQVEGGSTFTIEEEKPCRS